jgi:hypothetical protein
MTMQLLLSWENLIFELPLGLGLLYLALYTFSGWTFGDADTDAGAVDHDVDAHLDVHGDVAIDHDADLSGDANTDADSHSVESDNQATQPSSLIASLGWIGVGRMPLSLVILILMLSWGTLGLATLQITQGRRFETAVVIAIGVAAVGSLLVTHLISSVLGRTVFATLNVSRRRHELLGSLGEALYPIDEKFGMVCGRDDRGELFQVACRVEPGQLPLAKGSAVQLIAYTAEDQMFCVVPAESSKTPRAVLKG